MLLACAGGNAYSMNILLPLLGMFLSFSPGQSMGENGEHPRVVTPRSSSPGKPVDWTSFITYGCIC